jgi:hypothetical protein
MTPTYLFDIPFFGRRVDVWQPGKAYHYRSEVEDHASPQVTQGAQLCEDRYLAGRLDRLSRLMQGQGQFPLEPRIGLQQRFVDIGKCWIDPARILAQLHIFGQGLLQVADLCAEVV